MDFSDWKIDSMTTGDLMKFVEYDPVYVRAHKDRKKSVDSNTYMLEAYDVVNEDGDITGTIVRDTIRDKYRAVRNTECSDYSRALFSIFERRDEVPDSWVRRYISNCVCPPTRENMTDILIELGLPRYDEWGDIQEE